ncbi:unnamed protein product, partial [Mesorhabditis belari]|uniref:C-type lectin n=1 Tax=Mesorhabditis belari TaxID=2138241 RepID=A0AAF3FT62_9BILA
MVRNLIVSAAFLAIAVSQCPSDFTQFNNKCYKVFNYNSLTWAQADGSCQDYGGHLASIHDNATDNFLIDYARQVGVRTAAWIGVRNRGSGPSWSDSTALDFKNFAPAQDDPPICYAFSAVAFYYPGQWIPQSCDALMAYICQADFSPSVAASTVNPFTCGQPNYYGNNGTIQSPGYPQVFHKVDCTWQISVFNNYANIEFPPIKALAYWYLEIYAGNTRDTLLYTTTSFSPFNTTLKLSSNNPQMMIRIMTEDNDDVNPFEIHYSGTDSPLYINPTPPSMIKSRANRLH